jgi:lipoyl(octanoyl) transferase
MEVLSVNFGLTDFFSLWKIQTQLNSYKQKHESNDILIFTEHTNVYTLGKGGNPNHLLTDKEALAKNNIEYFEIDRGGDLTYHGPGQLVCYPIFDLHNYYLDTHRFLRDLEEVIILTLGQFGIAAGRDEQYTGVWVNDEKICSIGIKVSRWVTMHGLAFNVNNDLSYFDKIIPCGIFHKGMTSMKKITGKRQNMTEVSDSVRRNFESVFGCSLVETSPSDLKSSFTVLQCSPEE